MAVRTDVATAFRQTRRFRPVATARLGSIEAQGQGEAVASLAATVKHYGDGTGTTEMIGDVGKKQRKEKERWRWRPGLYNAVKAHGDNTQQLLHASATPKAATATTGR